MTGYRLDVSKTLVNPHFVIIFKEPLSVAARPSIAPVYRTVRDVDRVIVLERGRESSQLRGEIGILFLRNLGIRSGLGFMRNMLWINVSRQA